MDSINELADLWTDNVLEYHYSEQATATHIIVYDYHDYDENLRAYDEDGDEMWRIAGTIDDDTFDEFVGIGEVLNDTITAWTFGGTHYRIDLEDGEMECCGMHR